MKTADASENLRYSVDKPGKELSDYIARLEEIEKRDHRGWKGA